MKVVFLLGRVLFSLIFIVKPIEHLCPKMMQVAGEAGVPMPNLIVPLWGVVAFLGGLSILFGYKAKLGAWLLVIFLLPTTAYMHTFWSTSTPFAFMMHSLCFWKNISMLGAALMITHTGAGPYSLSK